MKGVVVVAPEEARWALRAYVMLRALGIHVARFPDERAVGLLLATGTVSHVLLDRRSTPSTWTQRRARLQAMAPRTRLLVIREDDEDDVPDAMTWPDDTDAVRKLLTSL